MPMEMAAMAVILARWLVMEGMENGVVVDVVSVFIVIVR